VLCQGRRKPLVRTAMRRTLALFAVAIFLAAAPAAAAPEPAYIVIDADNGAVLLHSGSDELRYPASVTKLMTAYVTFRALRSGQLKLTSAVKVSQNALDQPPSKMGFKVGTVLNVDNALKMIMVKSANDIAVALAETVGGSEANFLKLMNAEAARLGMASTHFNNPHGLPNDGQLSTARDLAVLARAVWLDFPEYREYLRIPAIRAGKTLMRSPNKLLEHFRGTTGMKTGFICASGFNIAASAERNGRHLIAVVMGAITADQRNEAAARLLNQGFAMWSGPTKPQLATFRAGPVRTAPINLREEVCGKKMQNEDDGAVDPVLAKLGSASALVPRFVLMEPVAVYTGRADPEPGAVGGPPPAHMPMPRLRPRNPDETAALPDDRLPMPLVNAN
jgi:D-alanyl-D-alanine carboxypeptidase